MPVTCECCLYKVSAHEPYYEPDYDLCETCFIQPHHHYGQRHWCLVPVTNTSMEGRFCNGCYVDLALGQYAYFPNSAKCCQCHANSELRDPKRAISMGYPESFAFQLFRLSKWTDYMPSQQVRGCSAQIKHEANASMYGQIMQGLGSSKAAQLAS